MLLNFIKRETPLEKALFFIIDNFTGTMNLSIKMKQILQMTRVYQIMIIIKLYNLQQFLESNR